MKWLKILLIICTIIIAGLVSLNMTKPERTAHYTALKSTIRDVVSKELNENPLLQPYATIGTMKALEATDELLTQSLVIHDHTYYNIGFLIYNDNLIPVSFGILGQIHLTMSQDDIEKFIKQPEFRKNIGLDDLQIQKILKDPKILKYLK